MTLYKLTYEQQTSGFGDQPFTPREYLTTDVDRARTYYGLVYNDSQGDGPTVRNLQAFSADIGDPAFAPVVLINEVQG